jgi:hypothetical protein
LEKRGGHGIVLIIEILIAIYVIISLVLGLSMSIRSKTFKTMSFWKQILALSISPILLVREIFISKEK